MSSLSIPRYKRLVIRMTLEPEDSNYRDSIHIQRMFTLDELDERHIGADAAVAVEAADMLTRLRRVAA